MNRRNASLFVALTMALGVSTNVCRVYAQARAVNKATTLATAYQVSGPYSSGNLSLFVIRGADKSKQKQYLTLAEGIGKQQVVVHETGDVNVLKVDNLSDAAVFMQSGEIVKGGRQDRALQSDMLIPPHAKDVNLPCFCVEHGRWSGRVGESASQFNSANNFVVGNSTNVAIRKDGDQSKVWAQVEAKQKQLGASLTKPVVSAASPSSLQLTLEEKSVKDATDKQFRALSEVVNKQKDAIGYAVAINGTISNADIYPAGGLFQKLWPGLLKSAVVEAVAQRGQSTKKLPSGQDVKNVLAAAEKFKPDPSAPYRLAPSLQGATNGSIAAQGQDATCITGVNTAGTVRVNSPMDYFFKTTDTKSGAVIHENFLGK